MLERNKRVYIFAGHYGSGKTNLAVNFAIAEKKSGEKVKIADLDIVNPYFRTKDSAAELEKAGIELISPAFANTNVDLPALPQEIYGLVQNNAFKAILDVGGDDRGAYALGRYAPFISEENSFEMCFVANFYRPLTRNADEAFVVMREIEQACSLPFTCIVNNSNLGNDTDALSVNKTISEADRLSELAQLPVWFTSVKADIAEEINAEAVFPITLQKKYFDIKEI